MAVSGRTVRGIVLALGVALLAVVVGFGVYAHFKAQRFLLGLPARLGINLEQETDGFTYSQSYKDKPIFTVHAAKQIQHRDGKLTLKDVGVVVYGRGAQAEARADRIHGSEFEYDQKNGVLRAVGDVYLEVAQPGVKEGDESRTVHLKTSGLVYLQKERTANTEAPVEFRMGGLSGTAVGASYAANTGSVVLESAVHVSGVQDDRPMVLTASHAELDRETNIVRLEGAKYVAEGDDGARTVAADRARIQLAEHGTPQRVEAEGHVSLAGEGAGRLSAPRMDLDLNAKGKPRMGHMAGGVLYANQASARRERGSADDLRVAFDDGGRPVHAVMSGTVALDVTGGESERRLRSDRLEVALSGGGRQKVLLHDAEATAARGAELRLADVDAKGAHSLTVVRADKLSGRFDTRGLATGLDGLGRTAVERTALSSAGAVLTADQSAGDTLHLAFKPGDKGRTELASATQTGSATSTRTSAPRKVGGAVETERARAGEIAYDAATDKVKLRGAVQIADAGSVLLADSVEEDRASRESVAEGGVRVSYADAGKSGDPVHVTAARALEHGGNGVAEFFAAPGGRVRMWQGGSSIESPAMVFDRTGKTVTAKNGVRGFLTAENGGVIRISSAEMVYADAPRTVVLTGGVRMADTQGTVAAREATVFLGDGEGSGASSMGGRVERVVGTGAVAVEQPGRKATGERLVYTAADQTFVLTGSPRMVDTERGVVTGSSLSFRRGDESVVVSGEGGRVRTETRAKQ